MKLNKKIVCLSAAAIMAVSAVSASAATLPIPKDNNEAFKLAESFYYDGLYYEAKAELGWVNNNWIGYDAAKAAAWASKIDYAISRMEIQTLLKQVQQYNDAGRYADALATLAVLNSRTDLTQEDYYVISWWEGVINAKLNKVVEITTEQAAINAVKATGFKLTSEYEWFSPVKVATGYHVYVKTQLPGGGNKDVAAFRVSTAGDVERAF